MTTGLGSANLGAGRDALARASRDKFHGTNCLAQFAGWKIAVPEIEEE
jgi:hypothetical protein